MIACSIHLHIKANKTIKTYKHRLRLAKSYSQIHTATFYGSPCGFVVVRRSAGNARQLWSDERQFIVETWLRLR